MKIIGIIPARLRSSRFPGKPLFLISGKTLLQRTFESAKKCSKLEELYVATDDEKIADHVRSFGGIPLMTSKNCKNGTARIVEAIKTNKRLQSADIIVNIQGDHPCISADAISQILAALLKDQAAQIATGATLMTYDEALSPNVIKCVFDLNQRALYFSRSLIPYKKTFSGTETFYYHVGLYAYRSSFLLHDYEHLKAGILQDKEDLEQLQFLENGFTIKVAQVAEKPLGVDIFDDIEKVEKFLCQQNLSSSPAV